MPAINDQRLILTIYVIRNTIYYFVIARSIATKQSHSLTPAVLMESSQLLILSYKTKDTGIIV